MADNNKQKKSDLPPKGSALRWPQVPVWLLATAVIAVLGIGALAVYRGGSFKITGAGGGAEIAGRAADSAPPYPAPANPSNVRTAIAELGRIAATLKVPTEATNPYGGALYLSHVGTGLKTKYECGDDAPCPEGTNGQATGALLSPFAVVQRPAQLQLLRSPAVHQYLLLDAMILDQAQRTSAEKESALTSSDPKDVKLLFDSSRDACNLDPNEVDATIGRVARLRGLEANAGFWIGDPGHPASTARFHLDDNPMRAGSQSKFPQFGHYLIMIGEASGLSYEQVDQVPVSALTTLIANEYRQAFEAANRFVETCRKSLPKP